jgi:hypothetical protein
MWNGVKIREEERKKITKKNIERLTQRKRGGETYSSNLTHNPNHFY